VRNPVKRKNSLWLVAGLGYASFCLPCIATGATTVDICQPPAAESRLSIAYYNNETTSFENELGTSSREDYSTDLAVSLNEQWIIGGGHRSAILNVDQLDLQTNGYLHTFFLPVHWLGQSGQKSFRFSIAPALSASSNVTSDPDEYSTDALQLLVGLVWDRQMSDQLGFRYGVCGDHRFGEYRVYPLISVDWQPDPDWTIELGFPTSQLIFQAAENLTSALRIVPNGNEWYVKDKSLEKESQVVYEAYLVEWAFSWSANRHLIFTASVAREFDSQYEFTLLDDERVRLSKDPATRIGVELTWVF
jgi:hypothetical protein